MESETDYKVWVDEAGAARGKNRMSCGRVNTIRIPLADESLLECARSQISKHFERLEKSVKLTIVTHGCVIGSGECGRHCQR